MYLNIFFFIKFSVFTGICTKIAIPTIESGGYENVQKKKRKKVRQKSSTAERKLRDFYDGYRGVFTRHKSDSTDRRITESPNSKIRNIFLPGRTSVFPEEQQKPRPGGKPHIFMKEQDWCVFLCIVHNESIIQIG